MGRRYDDAQRRATYKWFDNNPEYVRYHRALSAAKSFIHPKAGSKMMNACRWAKDDYRKDLKDLQAMINERLKKLSK